MIEPTILPVLRERRSVREYDDSHVLGASDLASVLEAARWAPSAGNSQPWAFLVGLRGDVAHRSFVPLLAPSVRRWAPAASALIFTVHQVASGPEDDAPSYSDYAAYDLGQAVAQLCVQAGALGLSCHQFAAFDRAGLAAVGGVPRHWSVTTGVTVGRGTVSDVGRRSRKPLSEIAYAGRFGTSLALEQGRTI